MSEYFIPIHQHMLIRGYVSSALTDPATGKHALRTLVRDIGMVPVTEPQCVYIDTPGNEGLTGSINLATSHVAFHIWDDTGLIMADVYSCCTFDPQIVIDSLSTSLGLYRYGYEIIDRLDLPLDKGKKNPI